MKHYTVEELDQYRHCGLSILERIQCKAHLKTCPECRQKLEELSADDILIDELRSSLRIFQELSDMPIPEGSSAAGAEGSRIGSGMTLYCK